MVILNAVSAPVNRDAAGEATRPPAPPLEPDDDDDGPADLTGYHRDGQSLNNQLDALVDECRRFLAAHRPADDRQALALCGIPDRTGRMADVDPEANGIWSDVLTLMNALLMCDSCIAGTLGGRTVYGEKLAAAAAVLAAAADQADALAASVVTAGTTDLAHPWREWAVGCGPETVRNLTAASWACRTHAAELRRTVHPFETRSRANQLADRLTALGLDTATPLRHLAYVRALAAEAVERAADAATWANEDEDRSRAVEHAVGRLLDCDETAALTDPLFAEYRAAVAGALAGWPEDRTNAAVNFALKNYKVGSLRTVGGFVDGEDADGDE